MKRKILAFVLATQLCVGVHSAGIPVFDASTFAQAVQSIEQMKKQIENQKSQITEQQRQYASMTGGRNLGTVLNHPELRQSLPGEWQQIYDKVKRGEIPGIDLNSLKGGLTSKNAGQQRYYDTLASNKGMSMAAYSKTLDRLNNIQELMKRVDTANDPKAAQDLMTRMSAEQAMIQNEQIRIGLMGRLQEAEMKMIQEQQDLDFRNKYFK